VRISHRIRDLQALPYVVVMQEGISKVYKVRCTVSRPIPQHYTTRWQLYWAAFEKYAQPPSTQKLYIGNVIL
jgi:pyruvate dehydrogenase kinase 2/3/4